MGDSISTYTGWSDIRPITGPEYTYRYGEAYYGPKGGDFHNTVLLVSDTWWHQAATELGGQILVSNAANSSGLLRAFYPSIPEWEHYLKDMRAYLSRPYYMGISKVHPDIIALYIGSADVTGSLSSFGSIQDVDFSTLIQKTGKNSYSYAEPATVAEACCILLHKLQVTYPKAEIYCFTVLPNAGGHTSTINTRLKNVLPFNEMIKGVAEHYGAFVVDIFDEFALDPDYDGVASDADVQAFQSCFNGDPHPNAKGFDIITSRFVSTILENSRFIVGSRKNPPAVTITTSTGSVDVETSAGKPESVMVNYTTESETSLARAAGDILVRTTGEAVDYLTDSGKIVNYAASSVKLTDVSGLTTGSDEASYTASSTEGYWSEGGSEESTQKRVPLLEAAFAIDDPEALPATVTLDSNHPTKPQLSGNVKTSNTDGIYDYTETRVLQQGKISVVTEGIDRFSRVSSGTDMKYVVSETEPTADNDYIQGHTPAALPETAPSISNGYNFAFLGTANLSEYWAAYAYTSPDHSALANEAPFYSNDSRSFYLCHKLSDFKNRKLLSKNISFKDKTVAGEFPGWYDTVQQFTLSDANRRIITAYCADQTTKTQDGFSYVMQNLDDAPYYSAEDAAHIRVIANHGYWGTRSGFGSLASIREMMRKSGKFTDDEIQMLTGGMAMTATQFAIWTCSNRMDDIQFINTYYTEVTTNALGYTTTDHTPQDAAALIFKLMYHLLSLAEEAPETNQHTADTVITEQNFLKHVSLSLTGKPESHEDNLDELQDNDVYTADLSFSLGVLPLDGNKDQLVVLIEDGLGNPIAAGRIAGDLKPGEVCLKPDANNRYTFAGLNISEGSQSISLRMNGTQNLKKDVYLFRSEEKSGITSQTLVGVAEGDYGVNVEMNLFFTLDVQDDVFSIKRFWRNEQPLPAMPGTGDSSSMPHLFGALAASCACLFFLLGKRRILR